MTAHRRTEREPLHGLRVAITGGTSGLGLALVRELLSRGARVAFVARTRERVEQVARENPGAHGIAGRFGARRAGGSDFEYLERCGGECLSGLGSVRVEQSRASSFESHLE